MDCLMLYLPLIDARTEVNYIWHTQLCWFLAVNRRKVYKPLFCERSVVNETTLIHLIWLPLWLYLCYHGVIHDRLHRHEHIVRAIIIFGENMSYWSCKAIKKLFWIVVNMIMAWPLKHRTKFNLIIINVYKIKIMVAKLAYFSLFIRSAWDWKA